jgi:VWFA-related protein
VVRGLDRRDFEILEDGRQVPIGSFTSAPQPLTLALLVETSWPSSRRYALLKDSALALIDALQPADRLRIGTFADEVALSPWLTSDRTILRRIVNEELWPHSGGRVWAAIDAAARSLAAEHGRRAIVVLTRRADGTFVDPCISGQAIRCSGGGLNPYGDLEATPVRRRLLAEGIGLYAVGLGGAGADLSADLRRTAEESGGADLVLGDGIDLTDAFAGVAEDLRHQYLLGFTPSLVDAREPCLGSRCPRRRQGPIMRCFC